MWICTERIDKKVSFLYILSHSKHEIKTRGGFKSSKRVGISSLISVVSISLEDNLKRASTAWWIIPAQWMTSKSNQIELNSHLLMSPVQSVRFMILINAEWSVHISNRMPSKYDICRSKAQRTERQYPCVVSKNI